MFFFRKTTAAIPIECSVVIMIGLT